jgi:hypothetical protein
MTKPKYLTNQQLLTELKERLPDFTQEEFTLLLSLLGKYQSEVLKIIQSQNPQIHS